jgi:hypothetical protein
MNGRAHRREWCLVPDSVHYTNIDLQEITSRNEIARQIIAGFSADMPTLSEVWRHLANALRDTPTLVIEVARLSAELTDARLDRANLLAAIRASVAARVEGESDPLSYIRDELDAHTATLRRQA